MEASGERKRLIYSILRMMNDDCNRCTANEARESLEVAMQCIGEVYGVDLADEGQEAASAASVNLQDIFNQHASHNTSIELTEQQMAEAQVLKEKGNDLLRQGEFERAVEMYTQAIAIDRRNAVYYANRAAARMKLQQYQSVVSDCVAAVDIDPTYTKAHYRLGNAYVALGRRQDALPCFRKAVELDPQNSAYRETLDGCLTEMAGATAGGGSGAPGRGMPGMPNIPGMPDLSNIDLSSVMSNPNFMNMATSLMNTPGFADMAASMMGGAAGGTSGSGDFMQRAEQLAQHMSETDPRLVDQVRQHMGGTGGDPGTGGDTGDAPPQN